MGKQQQLLQAGAVCQRHLLKAVPVPLGVCFSEVTLTHRKSWKCPHVALSCTPSQFDWVFAAQNQFRLQGLGIACWVHRKLKSLCPRFSKGMQRLTVPAHVCRERCGQSARAALTDATQQHVTRSAHSGEVTQILRLLVIAHVGARRQNAFTGSAWLPAHRIPRLHLTLDVHLKLLTFQMQRLVLCCRLFNITCWPSAHHTFSARSFRRMPVSAGSEIARVSRTGRPHDSRHHACLSQPKEKSFGADDINCTSRNSCTTYNASRLETLGST